MTSRGMQPADITAMVEVGDPRVSPDGSQIACVVTTMDADANEYRSRIWLVAADGSSPPRPLTAGEKRDGRPRWSPDGTRLAFVSHRSEQSGESAAKGSGLYVLPIVGGGEVVKLATSPEEIDDLAWSPDGTKIAFGARQRDEERYGKDKPKDQPPRRMTNLFYRLDSVGWTVDRPRKLFVVDVDASSKPEAVTTGQWSDGGLAWAPDGKSLYFSSGRHDDYDLDRAIDLFSVRLGGATPKRLTPTAEVYARPSPSPDGKRIACALGGDPSTAPRNTEIGVLDLRSGEVTCLTRELDRNCASLVGAPREPVWADGDLYFQAEDSGNIPLFRVPADGKGKCEVVIGGDRAVTGFDLVAGTLAFTAATATTLTELFVLDGGGTERQLTTFGARFVAGREIVAPERFTATSTDGEEVEAWVIKPASFKAGKTYPAILNIHGGPFSQYTNKLFDEFQVQAGAGYAVIYCNPRGSSGYGAASARMIRGKTADVDPGTGWGGIDYDDIMAVVDEAVKRFKFIDKKRLGVTGGSYGGYMTTWIAGHTKRFKAALSERACNNLLTLDSSCDIATAFGSWVGKSRLDDPDEFRRQSPITYADNITTPMLIMHSEEDLRCPIAQADELFSALRERRRTVEMVRFPGESHELSRSGAPRHRVQRMEVVLDWFNRYLK